MEGQVGYPFPPHSADTDGGGAIGVPMEVMGLMLGEFVDDYTVRVVDVRAPSYLISSFGKGGGKY